MKALINSRLFKPFRKSFLKKIENNIVIEKDYFCCKVRSWHSIFICWKNLKEVEANMDSKYLNKGLSYNCKFSWFNTKSQRLNFLDECLLKFENNEK